MSESLSSSPQGLVVLFDRESWGAPEFWLPSDALLNQWVAAALALSTPAAIANAPADDAVSIEVSVNCVLGPQMQALNAQYRDKDRVTNVLSFPADMPIFPAEDDSKVSTLILGDVIICPEVLVAEAGDQNKVLEHHWAHMVVHSVLHLNGLDHENEIAAKSMEQLEIKILSNLGIPNPYIAESAK